MKTLRSIVTNLKPPHTNLFWATLNHYLSRGSGDRCYGEYDEHHECAREYFGNSEFEIFYCECGVCIDNESTHYFEQALGNRYLCTNCLVDFHPVQP